MSNTARDNPDRQRFEMEVFTTRIKRILVLFVFQIFRDADPQ